MKGKGENLGLWESLWHGEYVVVFCGLRPQNTTTASLHPRIPERGENLFKLGALGNPEVLLPHPLNSVRIPEEPAKTVIERLGKEVYLKRIQKCKRAFGLRFY